MEQIEGIIDFHREEELTKEEKDKVVKAFLDEKNMKGQISCFADGNFVQFNIETKNPERQVISFTMDFTSLVGLCQDLGFDIHLAEKEPSEEEMKEIQEDLKHDGYKEYLKETKSERLD